MFSFGERELIRKHVPWTRVVADVRTSHYGTPVELLAFLRSERTNLVLKPSDEYGGTGVTVGWGCSEGGRGTANEKAIAPSPRWLVVQGQKSIPRGGFSLIPTER